MRFLLFLSSKMAPVTKPKPKNITTHPFTLDVDDLFDEDRMSLDDIITRKSLKDDVSLRFSRYHISFVFLPNAEELHVFHLRAWDVVLSTICSTFR